MEASIRLATRHEVRHGHTPSLVLACALPIHAAEPACHVARNNLLPGERHAIT